MSLTNGLLELYDEIQTEVTQRLQSVKSCASRDDPEDCATEATSDRPSSMDAPGKGEQTRNEHQDSVDSTVLVPISAVSCKELDVERPEALTCPRSGIHFLQQQDSMGVDDKKRPLSITSTSSSSSASTCSLTRHQRKKFANTTGTSPSRHVASEEHLGQMGDDDLHALEVLSTVDEYCDQLSCTDMEESKVTDEKPNLGELPSAQENLVDTSHLTCDNVTGEQDTCAESLTDSQCDSVNVIPDGNDVTGSDYVTNTSGEDISGMGMELQGREYIDRVILEIIQSEKAYVNDLKDVILGYMIYMWNTPELNVSKEDMELLFGNIDAIYNFNQRFLCCLENCENSPREISACFIRHKDGFTIYSEYCTNYPRCVEVFKRCMRNPCLATALKQQQLAMRHGLPLESYLLKPVQRVMKYHLFLQNMLNNHEMVDEEHDVIQRAHDAMLDVAERINEMKRWREEEDVRNPRHQPQQQQQHNSSNRSCDLYNEQQDNDLGHLILQDKFRMHKAKSLRQVFLFSKALLIGKKKEDGAFSVKAIVQSSDLMLIESVPNDPLCFHIVPFSSPKQQYTLQAKDMEQKRLWCQQIKRMMLENYNAVIPDKAKELVMELGNSQTDGNDDGKSKDKGVDSSKRRQHCAPEYLERRRTRQKGSFMLPDFKLKSKKGSRRSLEQMTSKQRLIPVPTYQSDKNVSDHTSPQHKQIEGDISPRQGPHGQQESLLSSTPRDSCRPISDCQNTFDDSLESTNQQSEGDNFTSTESSLQTLHSLSAESSSSITNNTTDSTDTLPDFSLDNINENISSSTPIIGVANTKQGSGSLIGNRKASDPSSAVELDVEQPDFEDPWLLRDSTSQRVESNSCSGNGSAVVIPIERLGGKTDYESSKSNKAASHNTSQQNSDRKRIVIPINIVNNKALNVQISTSDSVHCKLDNNCDKPVFQRSTSQISDADSSYCMEKHGSPTKTTKTISTKYSVKESKQTIEDISSKQVELRSYQRRSPSILTPGEKSEAMRCSSSSWKCDQSGASNESVSNSSWDESQHKIVRQFSKLYASRKSNGFNNYSQALKDLTRLLKDSQPGGSVIGSRMALAVNSSPGDMFTIAPPKHRGRLVMNKSVTDSSLCSNISPMLQQKSNRELELSNQDSRSISSDNVSDITGPRQYKIEINVEVLKKSGNLSASVIKLSDSLGSLSTSSESMSSNGLKSKSTSIEQITSTSKVSATYKPAVNGTMVECAKDIHLTSASNVPENSMTVMSTDSEDVHPISASNVQDHSSTVGFPEAVKINQFKKNSEDFFYEEQLLGTLECLNASSDSTLSLDRYSLNDSFVQSPSEQRIPVFRRQQSDQQNSLTSIDRVQCSSSLNQNGGQVENLVKRVHSFSDKTIDKDDTLHLMNSKERERRRELASCASVVRLRRDGLSYDRNEVVSRRRSRSLSMDKHSTSPE